MRVVYLARHPAAVACSVLAGQTLGLMPTSRRPVIASRCAQIEPALLGRLKVDPNQLTDLEIEVLHWRLDVRQAMDAIGDNRHAMLVFSRGALRGSGGRFGADVQSLRSGFSSALPALYRTKHASRKRCDGDWRVGHSPVLFRFFATPRSEKNKWKKPAAPGRTIPRIAADGGCGDIPTGPAAAYLVT